MMMIGKHGGQIRQLVGEHAKFDMFANIVAQCGHSINHI